MQQALILADPLLLMSMTISGRVGEGDVKSRFLNNVSAYRGVNIALASHISDFVCPITKNRTRMLRQATTYVFCLCGSNIGSNIKKLC